MLSDYLWEPWLDDNFWPCATKSDVTLVDKDEI